MKKTEEFKIFSEIDLEREFDSVSSILSDTKTDWNARIKALKRMQALITSEYIGFENFPTLFLKFTAPLTIQLQDLRSAIVKEAANTAVIAAQTLGDSFELCAERLSDGLYKLISSGNKILSETGSTCFIEIIKALVTWRLIPKTLEQFTSKNVNIRVNSCMFLQLMLEIYPYEVFEYAANNKTGFLEKIEQGIKLAVHDASSETRAIARKAFINYRSLFPARSSKLFNSFDPSIQRAFGELTESKTMSTPARSNSANASRMAQSVSKIDTKSAEKKPRNSLTEARDLSGTGGTTPELKPPATKEIRQVIEKPVKEEPSLEYLIFGTNDSNWSTRMSSFELIKKRVSEESSMRLINSNRAVWDQLISAHLEHMTESNFKVVAADLSSLYVITDTYPEKISLALEKILPKLLVCLSDSKDLVATSATQLLDLIIDIYIPEDLLALLLKYNSQDIKPGTYIKFIEVLNNLAVSSTEFFTINVNIKSYLLKLMSVLKEIPKSHARITLPAFETAFDKNRKVSLIIISEFPAPELAVFRCLLQENNSKLESLFREAPKEVAKDYPKPVPLVQEVKKPVVQEVKKPIMAQEVKKPLVIPQEPIKKLAPISIQEVKKSNFVNEEIKVSSPGTRQEMLRKVQRLNEQSDSTSFENSFQDILNICRQCSEDPSTCEAAVLTLQGIIKRRKLLCETYASECLDILSSAFYLDNRHLLQLTEDTIEELVVGMSFNTIVPVIILNIREQDVPAVQAFIRILTKIVMASKTSNILALARTIMNQLKESLNHSNADVRKSVVFCLVEMHALVNNDFNTYLEELTPSQQKLVTIYIQRRLTS